MKNNNNFFYSLFFALIYLLSASFVSAEILTTTGFIPGQIWYSKDPFVEGDKILIYTAVWNNNTSPLSAKVEFYDKNVLLGSRDVVVPASQLKEASVSWKVTSGDHSISAKIISPSITTSGKKQVVSLDHNITKVDSRFVPVVISKINGEPATSSDMVKNQIDKATSSLDSIVPVSVSEPVSKNLGFVEAFRDDLNKKITENKIETKNKIDLLNKQDDTKTNTTASNNSVNNKKITDKVSSDSIKSGTTDATEKPIAYLKLFFLSIVSFIFGSKLVFYLVIIFLLFLVLRSIYRAVRNR